MDTKADEATEHNPRGAAARCRVNELIVWRQLPVERKSA
jgi:hypothetical protein